MPPLNLHIECLAEDDWVDIDAPPELHLTHPHEAVLAPSPSGRKYSGFVVSEISALTAGLTTCDAWLALAEESMSACRMDVSSSGTCHAAHLTRVCAHALGTAEKHLRTESPAFKKPAKQTKTPLDRPHTRSARRIGSIARVTCCIAVCVFAFLAARATNVFAPCAPQAFAPSRHTHEASAKTEGKFCPLSNERAKIDKLTRMNDTIASLRAALYEANSLLESKETQVTALSQNVAHANQQAQTWGRAGEAWYDAYADAVSTKNSEKKKRKDLTKTCFVPT